LKENVGEKYVISCSDKFVCHFCVQNMKSVNIFVLSIVFRGYHLIIEAFI